MVDQVFASYEGWQERGPENSMVAVFKNVAGRTLAEDQNFPGVQEDRFEVGAETTADAVALASMMMAAFHRDLTKNSTFKRLTLMII